MKLAAHFTVSRSAVSQHLLLLEQAGLVASRTPHPGNSPATVTCAAVDVASN